MENDKAYWKCRYKLEKRYGDINAYTTSEERLAFLERTKPYEIIEGEDNCLLNTGINKIWDLITGVVSGTSHIYDNAKAQIGIGDSTTPANPSQTDLQAASNKIYKGMESGYPTSATQKVTFKSSFGSSEGNFSWNEWVIKQLTSTVCINRKVAALGTKTIGYTWMFEIHLSLS